MQTFGIGNLIKSAGESVMEVGNLENGETANKILPQDTKFAIVVEAIHKNVGDTFWETDKIERPPIPTSIIGGSIGTSFGSGYEHSAEGMVGRFLGYLSFTDSKIRVYQGMDVQAAATGSQQNTPQGIVESPQAQLILEDDLSNLAINYNQGALTLNTTNQQLKLLRAYPINNPGSYESSATGLYNGFGPMIQVLEAHGVSMQSVKKANKLIVVIFAVVIVAFTLIFTLAK